MKRCIVSAPLVLGLMLGATGARAMDLGVIGPTYEISEPHLLQMIEQRLRAKERSGELGRLEAQVRERGIATVKNPPPVTGLRATETVRTFYFDPSFTLDRNILGPQGELLFAAGTRKNPLEVVSLSRHLLFFDARDPRQVGRARQLIALYQGRVKPILVGGAYLDLMQSWHLPVYYDQQGLLTRRLGITQVPALVSQDGLRLRIDELAVSP
ncbi:MAG: type-F conjugative transfer system protein TraW [Pseudoxanthomonas sp.]|jgi:conjugal transfer pilus assembly protein TraW|nr:type-F conjugative transfer system protein TraW [Pseudoxanthomonas sp.]MBP8804001.1 type-F conjugative transfer system protein TraW [Pseudoxanthomonas sp.]MBP9536275.1 type-F conjugative transfer system protein TraW [Pseudoxanthomonas sp.]MBP9645888.1 type-F conjugative transfer system protein TraW [Pseudoxanthomonas sp.]